MFRVCGSNLGLVALLLLICTLIPTLLVITLLHSGHTQNYVDSIIHQFEEFLQRFTYCPFIYPHSPKEQPSSGQNIETNFSFLERELKLPGARNVTHV